MNRPRHILIGMLNTPEPKGFTLLELLIVIADDRAGIVSFADGHVEAKRWSDPRTFIPRQHGYPENSNADLKWIQERSTVPLPK
jgi:prepilin-type processing-associated H-X9-DG protein